jgi:hypothetical protein
VTGPKVISNAAIDRLVAILDRLASEEASDAQ